MIPNAPLHIIDHGSVLYLILMQTLLYDQHNVLSYAAVTTSVMMKAHDMIYNTAVLIITKILTSYSSPSYNIDSSSSTIYDEDYSASNNSPVAVIIMTTVVEMMTNDINARVYFDFIDAESSADNAESSAIIMMTTVFHELPSPFTMLWYTLLLLMQNSLLIIQHLLLLS